MKYWLATDFERFPILRERCDRPQNKFLGERVVLRLLEPCLDKGRNVTTNNFLTSLNLDNELKKRKTSIVGTLNRCRKEVLPSVKNARDPLKTTVI